MADYMTTKEVADRLNVGTDTIRRWAKLGKLPTFSAPSGFRLYPSDKIEEWIKRRTKDVE